MGAWLDLDDAVYNHHVAKRQLQELRAENKKYRLGMRENCELRARIAELEAERDRLREFLSHARCPYCDGSGATPHGPLPDGSWEAEQCQWCDERRAALEEKG